MSECVLMERKVEKQQQPSRDGPLYRVGTFLPLLWQRIDHQELRLHVSVNLLLLVSINTTFDLGFLGISGIWRSDLDENLFPDSPSTSPPNIKTPMTAEPLKDEIGGERRTEQFINELSAVALEPHTPSLCI